MNIEQNIDQLIRINKESSGELATLLDSFVDHKFKAHSMQFYSLNILYRIVFYQRGVLPLLIEFKSNSSYELPIAIILRAACLDILQFGYIMKCIDNTLLVDSKSLNENAISHENISKALNDIYYSNIKYQISDWKCMKDTGRISQEQYDSWESELTEQFSAFISEEKSNPLNAPKLFKTLVQHKKYWIYSEAFIDYAYYSKLEHFGILSYTYAINDPKSTKIAIQRISNLSVTLLFISKTGLGFLEVPKETLTKFDTWMNEILESETSMQL
jgi:hypothetical protein